MSPEADLHGDEHSALCRGMRPCECIYRAAKVLDPLRITQLVPSVSSTCRIREAAVGRGLLQL